MENHNEGLNINQQSASISSETLPGTPSSIDELFKNMNLPSLRFFDETNRDNEQRNVRYDNNSRPSTPELTFVENGDRIDHNDESALPATFVTVIRLNRDEPSLIENILSSESGGTIPDETPAVFPKLSQRYIPLQTISMRDPPVEDPPLRNGRGSVSASSQHSRQNYRHGERNSTCVHSVTETASGSNYEEDNQGLPSYEEAVRGSSTTVPEPQPGPSRSSKTSSVTSKLFNALKWKSSPRPVLEMVPNPLFINRLIDHEGYLLKFSTGMIVNKFHEWVPRSVVLSGRIIHTYQDPLKSQTKESLDLQFMLSLQNRIKCKPDNEGEIGLFCFEVVLALPKQQLLLSQPRQSHTFGIQKRSDRNLWMAKILQSVADVFPDSCLKEFTRAGWCYMKKSESSSWSGAWLLLKERKLYFFNDQDRQLEQLDLRKSRCIDEIQSDDSIRNLYVETGPSLFIDGPPYTRLYFIMASPHETQIWKKLIQCIAQQNGDCLHSQQLTKNDVPVIIDKCINFMYAHGSMSEGIYRMSGSSSLVNKILQLFKEDAFAVQLTRAEFNEYDVAGALKMFLRDIPGTFFGSYTINFVSVTSLKSTEDKISSFKELLSQLPKIEYQTLKKLIGHLSFIASLEKHNKMGVRSLAMIWGSTLMANNYQNSQEASYVVADLIKLYRNIFPVSPEEIEKEQLMMKALQRYHAAAEDLSGAVKHSGDLKVWITMECDTERIQFNMTLTPAKTASDICKELASKTPYEWYNLTLYEVIDDGALNRPVHYSEKALEIVLKWTYWNDADRRNNYLAVRPTTILNVVFRHIQQAPLLSPATELKFADQHTKTLRSYKLQLIGQEIGVLKQLGNKRYEEVMTINLETVHVYLGMEAKRDQSSLRWSITLVEHDFKKRTRDAPFIGHILGGTDVTEQILWYSSILHSLHLEDILPSRDLRPATWL